jgi:hypothetical protein
MLITLFAMACAPPSTNSSKKLLSVDELIEMKGEPDSKGTSIVDKESKMFKYGKDSFQVKDNKVIMKFKSPEEQEKTIQYWRHKFSSEVYTIKMHNQTEHTQDFKLVHPKRGLTIVFNEKGMVLRIAKNGENLNE